VLLCDYELFVGKRGIELPKLRIRLIVGHPIILQKMISEQ
jgi:hypothetical protein